MRTWFRMRSRAFSWVEKTFNGLANKGLTSRSLRINMVISAPSLFARCPVVLPVNRSGQCGKSLRQPSKPRWFRTQTCPVDPLIPGVSAHAENLRDGIAVCPECRPVRESQISPKGMSRLGKICPCSRGSTARSG